MVRRAVLDFWEAAAVAGDWIKMRTDLRDDPRVLAVADQLQVDPDLIVGKLHRLWSYADKYTTDGLIPHTTASSLDKMLGIEGFSGALTAVHWLDNEPQGLKIPRFDEHNGTSAKRRAQEATRKAAVRSLSANSPQVMRTGSGRDAELEKRREEESIVSPNGDTPASPSSEADPEPPITPNELGAAYNDYCAQRYGLAKVTLPLSAKRREKVNARLREHPESKWWGKVFAAVSSSSFLTGRTGKGTWRADFDWLTKNSENGLRVLEGKYRDDQPRRT